MRDEVTEMMSVLSRWLNWDFVRMGKGIEARYSRCSTYWEPHLACTRAFIESHIEPGGRLAILGAGRLLDVDLKKLIPQFSEIHLFDADSSVIRAWRKTTGVAFRDTVIPRILDVTGSIQPWSAGIVTSIRRGQLAEYLSSLIPLRAAWEEEPFDGVISLNLVGQIPLYWRDRVLTAANRELSEREDRALIDSMGRLQSAHLAATRTHPRRWSIVITDTEYYTYQVDTPEWDVEPALHGEARRELEASSLMERHGNECWLWHLLPQFVESDGEGCIHRVEASAWRTRESSVPNSSANFRP